MGLTKRRKGFYTSLPDPKQSVLLSEYKTVSAALQKQTVNACFRIKTVSAAYEIEMHL